MLRAMRNRLSDPGGTAALWRGPLSLGLGTAPLLWVVWYFTKLPCTMENAQAGICNAGTLARYIDNQILGQCILLGIAVAAVRGGYNEIMVSRERKRADAAEARADEAEERLRQERKRADERIEELLAERRAEQERIEAEREQREAERQADRELDRAERQAMVDTMAQISDTLAQLVARQNNGQSSSEDR